MGTYPPLESESDILFNFRNINAYICTILLLLLLDLFVCCVYL